MKKKTSISDKTLKLIEQKQIKLIPKWEFVARNWGLWLAFGISLMAGILGTGLSWFGLIDKIITPYWWILVAIIFLILAYFIFEKTKKAYRRPQWQVALMLMVGGLVIGVGLFKIGWANRIDKNLEKNFPYYRQIVPMKLEVWNNPNEGYLAGVIVKINGANNWEIEDFDGKRWTIFGDNILIRGRALIEIGQEIKIIGELRGNSSFEAEEIRPWSGINQTNLKEN